MQVGMILLDAIDADTRCATEAHLVVCPTDCLSDYNFEQRNFTHFTKAVKKKPARL